MARKPAAGGWTQCAIQGVITGSNLLEKVEIEAGSNGLLHVGATVDPPDGPDTFAFATICGGGG